MSGENRPKRAITLAKRGRDFFLTTQPPFRNEEGVDYPFVDTPPRRDGAGVLIADEKAQVFVYDRGSFGWEVAEREEMFVEHARQLVEILGEDNATLHETIRELGAAAVETSQ